MNNKVIKNSQGQLQFPCSTGVFSKHTLQDATQSKVFSAITMTSAVWKAGQKGIITITFGSNGCQGCTVNGAWSYIGNESNEYMPSMNLGFIDPPYGSFEYDGVTYSVPANAVRNYCGTTGQRSCTPGWVPGATVIHEFGHALGMLHEHQNDLYNSNPIKLNVAAVKSDYGSLEEAATNVLNEYECTSSRCNYAGTRFDPNSIMLYFLPDTWVVGRNPTRPNFVLSNDDKEWLKRLYPKESSNQPEITVRFIDPGAPAWKKAWVTKMVTEIYGPLVGVKWNFITGIRRTGGKGISKRASADAGAPTADSGTGTLTADQPRPNNNFTTKCTDNIPSNCVEGTELTMEQLVAILVIVIPISIVLIIAIIYFTRDNLKI